MNPTIPAKKVTIIGGGTAGWLAACVIAATRPAHEVGVTLVESPDIPTIGVGEGTWPSMRQTLAKIGIGEREFLAACDASYKQGTQFVAWSENTLAARYLHPFSLPVEYTALNPARAWLAHATTQDFASFATLQDALVDQHLAPKTVDMPEYAFVGNYGYHLDAARFVELLRKHGTQALGVEHIAANVDLVKQNADGSIDGVELDDGAFLEADLFVDCTGHRGLLINQVDDQGYVDVGDILFNNAAIAVQVPYGSEDAVIRSATVATAHEAGWIWDIGLQGRRGVGCVFSTAYMQETEAQKILETYLANGEQCAGLSADRGARLDYKSLRFTPQYRRRFWVKNCVAAGLSAGFVEPLEASAIALAEQAANAIAADFPMDSQIMSVVAERFNQKMSYHWQKIIEFLKLHYVLSKRADNGYWQAHRSMDSWPEGLAERLALWQQQPPYHDDAPMLQELFPAASYQFVLYGMGFKPRYNRDLNAEERSRLDAALHQLSLKRNEVLSKLPTNRDLLTNYMARPHE